MYKLEISITKDILELTKNCSGEGLPIKHRIGQNCAIGKAIFDIFPNSWTCDNEIFINRMPVYFTEKGYMAENRSSPSWYSTSIPIALPSEAREFIEEFDESTPEERVEMQPFSFEIEIPDEVIEMINIDEVKEVLKEHHCLKLVEC